MAFKYLNLTFFKQRIGKILSYIKFIFIPFIYIYKQYIKLRDAISSFLQPYIKCILIPFIYIYRKYVNIRDAISSFLQPYIDIVSPYKNIIGVVITIALVEWFFFNLFQGILNFDNYNLYLYTPFMVLLILVPISMISEKVSKNKDLVSKFVLAIVFLWTASSIEFIFEIQALNQLVNEFKNFTSFPFDIFLNIVNVKELSAAILSISLYAYSIILFLQISLKSRNINYSEIKISERLLDFSFACKNIVIISIILSTEMLKYYAN